MTLAELAAQQHKQSWRWFPNIAGDLKHHVLGLAGEVGEVANLVKKWDRGDFELGDSIQVERPYETQFDEQTYREVIGEEVIDVLIYVLNICAVLGIDPDEILEMKNELNESRFGRRAPNSIDDSTGDVAAGSL